MDEKVSDRKEFYEFKGNGFTITALPHTSAVSGEEVWIFVGHCLGNLKPVVIDNVSNENVKIIANVLDQFLEIRDYNASYEDAAAVVNALSDCLVKPAGHHSNDEGYPAQEGSTSQEESAGAAEPDGFSDDLHDVIRELLIASGKPFLITGFGKDAAKTELENILHKMYPGDIRIGIRVGKPAVLEPNDHHFVIFSCSPPVLPLGADKIDDLVKIMHGETAFMNINIYPKSSSECFETTEKVDQTDEVSNYLNNPDNITQALINIAEGNQELSDKTNSYLRAILKTLKKIAKRLK